MFVAFEYLDKNFRDFLLFAEGAMVFIPPTNESTESIIYKCLDVFFGDGNMTLANAYNNSTHYYMNS